MIAKFNLYDFIANLVPGLTFLWALEHIGRLVSWSSPIPMSGQLAETSVLIVLSYVTGLMLQAVAERVTEKQVLLRLWGGFPSARWLLPDDTRFSPALKQRILELVAERFKIPTITEVPPGTTPEEERAFRLQRNEELFHLCYNYVDNLSPRPQIFNAQYGLFRCLLTTFAILSGLCIVLGFWNRYLHPTNTIRLGLLAGLFGSLAWLSYCRCQKRGEDFARAIYDLFSSMPAKA